MSVRLGCLVTVGILMLGGGSRMGLLTCLVKQEMQMCFD